MELHLKIDIEFLLNRSAADRRNCHGDLNSDILDSGCWCLNFLKGEQDGSLAFVRVKSLVGIFDKIETGQSARRDRDLVKSAEGRVLDLLGTNYNRSAIFEPRRLGGEGERRLNCRWTGVNSVRDGRSA